MNTLLECLIILCSKFYALFECLVRTHIFHCKYLVCIFEFVLHQRPCFLLNYMHKMNKYLKLGFFFRYVSAEYAFITVGIYIVCIKCIAVQTNCVILPFFSFVSVETWLIHVMCNPVLYV